MDNNLVSEARSESTIVLNVEAHKVLNEDLGDLPLSITVIDGTGRLLFNEVLGPKGVKGEYDSIEAHADTLRTIFAAAKTIVTYHDAYYIKAFGDAGIELPTEKLSDLADRLNQAVMYDADDFIFSERTMLQYWGRLDKLAGPEVTPLLGARRCEHILDSWENWGRSYYVRHPEAIPKG